MKIKVMNAGDKVLSVTSELVAIERSNGEVEIFSLRKTRQGYVVDTQDTLIIGYDAEETQTEIIDGVTITHF